MHVRRMGRDPGFVSCYWYWVSLQDHMHNFFVPLLSTSIGNDINMEYGQHREGGFGAVTQRIRLQKCHRQRHVSWSTAAQRDPFALCNLLSWRVMFRQWRGVMGWAGFDCLRPGAGLSRLSKFWEEVQYGERHDRDPRFFRPK